jgi:hypothetical protein
VLCGLCQVTKELGFSNCAPWFLPSQFQRLHHSFLQLLKRKDIFEVAKSMQPLKQDQVKILANAPRICMELQD